MPYRLIAFLATTSLAAMTLPTLILAAEGERPAAKVDGTAITQGQIDAELANSSSLTHGDRQSVLERLITRALMAKEARREKLDQDPHVMAEIEAAKNRILAQAYLTNQALKVTAPTPAMIQFYYDENPTLFGERGIYELQQIAIEVGPEQLPAVNEHYNQIGTLSEMVDWLNANNIPHKSSSSVKAAEDLPSDLLKPVAQLKPGQVIKVTTNRGIAILQLTGKHSEPLTLPKARASIERFLSKRALAAKVNEAAARLRNDSAIEYYPPYGPSLE